ncbi:hypothetical protein T492DRAFT_831234 [Pavlovales sp. CCMP2436]|nr:hypothetical protein T492DRAFT_831234 [Pavlovales sp. CCMP2436]
MKVRPRLGVVFDDREEIASITCTGCGEQKTSNEMNHRRRKTGEIKITNKCGTCYRTQARSLRISTHRKTFKTIPDHFRSSRISKILGMIQISKMIARVILAK